MMGTSLNDYELCAANAIMGIDPMEIEVHPAWDGTPIFYWRGMEWSFSPMKPRPFFVVSEFGRKEGLAGSITRKIE
jgi:hypothetical protein